MRENRTYGLTRGWRKQGQQLRLVLPIHYRLFPHSTLPKFAGGAKGVAILALFKTRAAHGLSL